MGRVEFKLLTATTADPRKLKSQVDQLAASTLIYLFSLFVIYASQKPSSKKKNENKRKKKGKFSDEGILNT